MTSSRRHLLLFLCLVAALLVSGCCAPKKSVVVLLPEDGRASGEVTVGNARGVQVLDQPWQAVEISGGRAAQPVVMAQSAVTQQFGALTAVMPAPPVHYRLLFQLDSCELLPESRTLLPEIAKTVAERQPAQLSLVGHADTTGGIEYNYKLGLRRAAAVAGLLRSLGAAPVSVEILSRGELEPLVKTADETPEPRNRRVEVTVR